MQRQSSWWHVAVHYLPFFLWLTHWPPGAAVATLDMQLWKTFYTARQLYGIISLAPPFWLTSGGNLYFNIRPLSIQGLWKQSKDLLSWLPDKRLWLATPIVHSQSAYFLGSADFPSCQKGNVAYLCWSHSALRLRFMQITISNQSGNHANQYSVCNYWKHCSVLGSHVLRFDMVGCIHRWLPAEYDQHKCVRLPLVFIIGKISTYEKEGWPGLYKSDGRP